MGASLILLGITLIAGQFFNENIFSYIKLWMPILLIIIGSEVLIYLFFHKKEGSFIKYDFISIFFVSIIGCLGIVFTVGMSSGLIGEWEKVLYAKEMTEELPSSVTPVPEEVSKVVLMYGGSSQVNVQKSNESNLHVFGRYTYTRYGEEKDHFIAGGGVSKTEKIGDTLYVKIKSYPIERGLFRNSGYMDVTIVVPETVQVMNEYHEKF
jgi:hypothetical protein